MQLLSIRAALLLALVTGVAQAQDSGGQDKSQYTLFHPTPQEQMRAWRTDQAGVSPYTIDAGHFEAEVQVLSYGLLERDEVFTAFTAFTPTLLHEEFQRWTFGSMVLKAGLLNKLDAEVGLVPYTTSTIRFESRPLAAWPFILPLFTQKNSVTYSGFGDVVTRLKFNVWGNDEGTTALSLSGTVKFPTADKGLGNDQFEGGPAVEFAARLPYDFGLRLNSGVNFFEALEDPFGGEERQATFLNLISLSHRIVGNLEGYCAFNTAVSTVTHWDWNAALRAGANYRLCPNAELFAGCDFGLNGFTEDFSPFLGFNVRY